MSARLISLMGSLRPLLGALILFPGPACVPALRAQSAAPAPAQTPATLPADAQFDVAAIHPHSPEPHEHNSIWSSPFDGHFKATNVSLIMLIQWAWQTPETRILGAPAWAGTTMFNIEAAADASVDAQLKALSSDAGRQQKERMVQALLADRFKLVTHTETRELPIYDLVVAKDGPKLGDLKDTGTSINLGRDHMEVQGSNSVSLLADQLSKVVGRDVIDKSGIAGRYDLKLHWTPDDSATSTADGSAADASGPSIFTALEEQLGLKLEPAKGPVRVLVIDHAEMPSEN
jgi:uncharacterized protein (TIGR03435 family)